MANNYVVPEYRLDAFNCPNCGAYAHQKWYIGATLYEEWDGTGECRQLDLCIKVSYCERCDKCALWRNELLLYPPEYATPIASIDMPEDVKTDYEEARSIYSKSPRGAAALLRLAIQKLVINLGEKGKNLNADIGNLVKRGLSGLIQQALDIVRVIGNNAVHPGQIDINDKPETALRLFNLVNIIVEQLITQPQKVKELYDSLPEESIKQISERDNSTEEADPRGTGTK